MRFLKTRLKSIFQPPVPKPGVAGVIAALFLLILASLVFVLFRMVGPMIIDLHFTGSLFVGLATEVAGALGIIYLGFVMHKIVVRLMTGPQQK